MTDRTETRPDSRSTVTTTGEPTPPHPTASGSRYPRWSGHLETLRPYDLVVVSLVGALGAALAAPAPQPSAVGLAAVVGAAACTGALYGADHLTRRQDLVSKPYRPIPSGRLSPRTVKACAVAALSAVVVLSSLINVRSLLFVALGAAGNHAYGKWLKGRGLWGDAAMGFAGWSCAVLAGACFTAPWPPPSLVVVAVVLGLQGMFSNLLLALNDRPDDRASRCGTFPVRHGPTGSAVVLGVLALVTYACAASIPAVMTRAPSAGFLVLLGAAAALAVSALMAVRPRPAREIETQRAVTPHLYERLLLPGALWMTTGQTTVAVLLTGIGALVVRLTPRPMLRPEAVQS